jgi:hypothetical protein
MIAVINGNENTQGLIGNAVSNFAGKKITQSAYPVKVMCRVGGNLWKSSWGGVMSRFPVGLSRAFQ